ncbi:SOS response-associated peptidase [Halopseudomonas laoshanensis]|uniref:SOS response-associated peptidase n=1 Tax=Halopseudomonas laoshanensis TaxID=2268758 RepID=UPI0037366BA8
MCSHYEPPGKERLMDAFGSAPDEDYQLDLWPLYSGPFVRLRQDSEGDELSDFTVDVGQFGLLPHWAKDRKYGRRTYNSRSETAAELASFRSAWAKGQHCVIPAASIYEPDWRTGKSISTQIQRSDQGLMAIAGLWDQWRGPDGEEVLSFSMLTVNADDHAFMQNYHRPKDEKRMLVILPNGLIRDWLSASADESMEFMRQYPADRLRAV